MTFDHDYENHSNDEDEVSSKFNLPNLPKFTNFYYLSRISIFDVTRRKRYNIRGKNILGNFLNVYEKYELYLNADFRHSYIFSISSLLDKLSMEIEFGNPYIRAFYSSGKWPLFTPLERMCIFLIELSVGCLVTAFYLESVTIKPFLINGVDYTEEKLAFQIEVLFIMPFMGLVEWVFGKYVEFKSGDVSFIYRSRNVSDGNEKITQIATNNLSTLCKKVIIA